MRPYLQRSPVLVSGLSASQEEDGPTMPYATLCQTSASQVVLHFVVPPMSQRSNGSDVPAAPLIHPDLSSVKWDSKKQI